jgi:hypothetical protein
MTYLSNKFCRKIIKKCIATSVKLLCQLDELKKSHTMYNQNKLSELKRELIAINNLIEATNHYITVINYTDTSEI